MNFSCETKDYLFFIFRAYVEEIRTVVCYYENPFIENQTESDDNSILTPDNKRIYLMFTVIIRVFIPFMLLLTANIILFGCLRRSERRSLGSEQIFLVRHGQHRQITPMIFFSSCFLLLTVSPR